MLPNDMTPAKLAEIMGDITLASMLDGLVPLLALAKTEGVLIRMAEAGQWTFIVEKEELDSRHKRNIANTKGILFVWQYANQLNGPLAETDTALNLLETLTKIGGEDKAREKNVVLCELLIQIFEIMEKDPNRNRKDWNRFLGLMNQNYQVSKKAAEYFTKFMDQAVAMWFMENTNPELLHGNVSPDHPIPQVVRCLFRALFLNRNMFPIDHAIVSRLAYEVTSFPWFDLGTNITKDMPKKDAVADACIGAVKKIVAFGQFIRSLSEDFVKAFPRWAKTTEFTFDLTTCRILSWRVEIHDSHGDVGDGGRIGKVIKVNRWVDEYFALHNQQGQIIMKNHIPGEKVDILILI